MQRYNPKEIETKWQQAWEESKLYQASDDAQKPKKYILEFFPYPSGAAMHVGHVRNYAIGDAMTRFNRMLGYNVLHPMGWDGFGLPAENYAIKTGISPRQAIDQNTARFREQLTQMGFGYDWSREIDSTDPNYYRWTQWFFLLLFKKGLAYQKESLQWWCDTDKTVLANEQVEAGLCWRCGNQVEKKLLKQWFFKITDYAERLLNDLEDLDWSDAIKSMQRNWIGRSKGAEVNFAVAGSDQTITVFTTRPDTLFGATFLVIAPENPLLASLVSVEQKQAVDGYVKTAQAKSDIERQETDREKTGVFTGAYAVNPLTGQEIPIWTADYVLAGYGTGAIMAVPAHDDRDFEFARKLELPITSVVAPVFIKANDKVDTSAATERQVVLAAAYDATSDKYCLINWREGSERPGLEWPGGGIDEGETQAEAALREFTEETGYTDATVDKVNHQLYCYYYSSRQGQPKRNIGAIAELSLNSLAHSGIVGVEDNEKDAYEVLWLTKIEILARQAEMAPLYQSVTEALFDQVSHTGEGVLVNSGKFNNVPTSQAREQIVAELEAQAQGKAVTNYRIRDWLISRQRYWGAPIPIVHCTEHGAVAVPEDQLPVLLPEVQSFAPSGDGRSPLAKVPEFVNTTCPTCGGAAERETDTMDGFACSSWYFLRFADPHNNEFAFDAEKVKQWLPVDEYIGGAEHAVMHLLYARFWTKIMQDEGLIDFSEPFLTLRNQGMLLAPDGVKMSKSKGNTIEPGHLISQGYGADSVRINALFMGPWNQSVNWSVEGMGGSHRFLQRIWTLTQEFMAVDAARQGGAIDSTIVQSDILRAIHKSIKKVTSDLEALNFNTAISAQMECLNSLYKLKDQDEFTSLETWRFAIDTILQLVAPFAPHMAEELWSQMGHEESVHTSEWPKFDSEMLIESKLTIVVQVNGKVRAELSVDADTGEPEIVALAHANDKIATLLANGQVRKTIFVPGKLVNFVVG